MSQITPSSHDHCLHYSTWLKHAHYPLPSTFGFSEINRLGQESLAKKELSLREEQAMIN